MTAGLVLISLGLFLFGYAYLNYKKQINNLAEIKKQDLVSYYLDLAYEMLPYKLWSAIAGIILVLTGTIVLIVNI
ncbi:MAG TPA: hypothetical protein DER33_03200 [Syntrophomonas sp.]|jgi:hypothetical protein|nr:hypothetical protein [Syntrophomonas sp.]HCF70591.1 hypothetical protein [Syntrophomonas sp.]